MNLMGYEVQIEFLKEEDGVSYELYKDNAEGGIFRVVDLDSNKVIGTKHFPSFSKAMEEHAKALRHAGLWN